MIHIIFNVKYTKIINHQKGFLSEVNSLCSHAYKFQWFCCCYDPIIPKYILNLCRFPKGVSQNYAVTNAMLPVC